MVSPISPICLVLASIVAVSASTSVLGGHETLVRGDGLVLCTGRICQIRSHGVAHLLQYAKDLPALRRIIGALRQEGCDGFLVHLRQICLRDHALKNMRSGGLQEASSHTLFDCRDRLGNRRNVSIVIGLECSICSGLLLAKRSCLLHRSFRCRAIALCPLEVRFCSRQLCLAFFDG